jgi:hypothetical protein
LRGLRGGAERGKYLSCKEDDNELRAVEGRENANIKRKILERDLPHTIKNITNKMIIVCCKVRKLEELV